MVQSTSLCNSSHYDVNDDTITITTWVEETIGNTTNWYLVFPNISLNNSSNGTIIQLYHGCTVTWDAAALRHASSRVSYRLRGGGQSSGLCETRRKQRQAENSERNREAHTGTHAQV